MPHVLGAQLSAAQDWVLLLPGAGHARSAAHNQWRRSWLWFHLNKFPPARCLRWSGRLRRHGRRWAARRSRRGSRRRRAARGQRKEAVARQQRGRQRGRRSKQRGRVRRGAHQRGRSGRRGLGRVRRQTGWSRMRCRSECVWGGSECRCFARLAPERRSASCFIPPCPISENQARVCAQCNALARRKGSTAQEEERLERLTVQRRAETYTRPLSSSLFSDSAGHRAVMK